MPRHARILIPVLAAMTLLSTAMPAVAADRDADTALHVLDTLTVEPQSDTYDADRDRPKDWAEIDDGPGPEYDTRDLILARDLTDVTWNDKGHVVTGTLLDPYTGKTIDFKRTGYDGPGTGNSNAVQIDHVVAFGEAWESGLDDKGEETAERYYNDPYVLLAVDGPTNASKNDSDAAGWVPSTRTGDTSYDCRYVARQIGIKARYGLSVDQAEKSVMEDTLAACPAITVPADGGAYWWYDEDAGETPEYTAGDLTGLTAVVDGQPYTGFTPDNASYGLPDGDHTVAITGAPEGWTVMSATEASGTAVTRTFTIVAPDGTTVASYRFTWDTVGQTGGGDTPQTPVVPDADDDADAGDDSAETSDANDETVTAADQGDRLPATGATVLGVGVPALMIIACGALLAMLRRRTRD